MRGSIMGIGAVVALAVAALLLQVAAGDDAKDQFKRVVNRVDKLTYGIYDLEKKIDARIDPERIERAGTLKARVDAISEPTCESDYHQCGGTDPQCISNLFVCDGHKDCRNGEDEKHCDVPLKPGDRFIGDKEFDHCGKLNPDHITAIVNSVTTFAFFTSFPKLSLTLKIHVDGDDDETELSINVVGFYSLATHQMFFKAAGDSNLALIGQFDGHNFDRFVGESVSEGSQEPCARFIYHRQH